MDKNKNKISEQIKVIIELITVVKNLWWWPGMS
jgi:hypothetical protein